METYYQNQGFAGCNNYGNNHCLGYQTHNPSQRNQVSVEQYNPNVQQVSQGQQSGQGSPEQPPMPPEAEAALSQLKNLPCPKQYFPPSMLNSNLPNAPQCNWNQGSSNSYSPSNSMFMQNNMQGNFQNPHAANNTQLHAQNFQLHQELHGTGRSSQGDFHSAMSNSQRQHALNPQLHAQNFAMHQNIHGVGKAGNQGPQHSKAPQSEKNNAGSRKFKYQPPAVNQQQTQQTGQTNNYQYSQSYTTPYNATPATQYNMGQYSMGQQSMTQPMTDNSTAQNSSHQHTIDMHQHPTCQHSTDPHSNYHSVGNYSADQHSMNPHAMNNNYSMGQQNMMTDNTMTQYSSPNNYTGSHYSHNHTHEDMTAQAIPHHNNNYSYQTHTHDTDNKFHYHMPQQTTDHYHTHSENTQQPSNETSSYPTHNNYTMRDVGPTSHDSLSVCRQDNSSQIQEILCSEPEPHLTIVQRSRGSHDLAKFNERNVNDGGEVYSIKPCIHHEASYPVQQNRIYSSMPNIQKMVPVNQERSNGLQGIRSTQGFSAKSWVIGPPAKKNRQDWMKHYA